jgi:hypothetical protein
VCRHYFKDNDALIFVIDCADRARLEEARKELAALLSEPQLADSIVLVYANKADLPTALPGTDLVSAGKGEGGDRKEGRRTRGRRKGDQGLTLSPRVFSMCVLWCQVRLLDMDTLTGKQQHIHP